MDRSNREFIIKIFEGLHEKEEIRCRIQKTSSSAISLCLTFHAIDIDPLL